MCFFALVVQIQNFLTKKNKNRKNFYVPKVQINDITVYEETRNGVIYSMCICNGYGREFGANQNKFVQNACKSLRNFLKLSKHACFYMQNEHPCGFKLLHVSNKNEHIKS